MDDAAIFDTLISRQYILTEELVYWPMSSVVKAENSLRKLGGQGSLMYIRN